MKHMIAWLVAIMVVIIYTIGWYLFLWPTIPLPGIKYGRVNFFEWIIWTAICWYIFWYLIALEESCRIEELAAKNAMRKAAGLLKETKTEKKKSIDDILGDAIKKKIEESEGGEK